MNISQAKAIFIFGTVTQGFMKVWYAVFWTSALCFAAGVLLYIMDFFSLLRAGIQNK